jgi:hypothetical protein
MFGIGTIISLITGRLSLNSVLAFFSSPAGYIVILVVSCFGTHVWTRHRDKAECRAEIARSVEQAKAMDVAIARRAGTRSEADKAHNAELATTLEQQEVKYAQDIATKGPACPIDDADVGNIGGVQPDVSGPIPLPPRRGLSHPASRPAPAHSPR